ncbi:hypothetical protein SRHO_G00099750 [Serrasalmus rhombeus]
MKLLLLMSLLIYSSIQTAQTGILSQSGTEGRDVILACGNEGKVVWSKGADRGRSTILTAEDGEITQRLRPDPENRYSVLPDLSLVIRSVSLSDSGIYYCNSAPAVNLTVNPAPPAAKRTTTKTTEASTTTEGSSERPTQVSALWNFLVIAGSCLVAVLLVLFPWRCFHKRKEDCEMPYDDVYTTIEYVAFNKEQTGAVGVKIPQLTRLII